jgi:hypothetical protein
MTNKRKAPIPRQLITLPTLVYDSATATDGKANARTRPLVPQDNVRAYFWFILAAARGDQVAINNQNRVVRQMTQAQIAEAKKFVREWKPKKTAD